MKKIIFFMALSAGALLFSACSNNIARFSVASTASLPIKMEKGDVVVGKDCINYVFGYPFGNTNNRVSGAVADALNVASKKGQPSDALANVDISSSYWSIIIFGRDCISAKGQAISTK